MSKSATKTLLVGASLMLHQLAFAAPTISCLANSSCGPIPGESSIYNHYNHIEAPWPGNTTGAVLNTTYGPAGPDDLLFQNLLAAEWIIFSFYQQGVEFFNKTAFVDAGFPKDTYERIQEIRNNEAGHLRIFQNQISSNSVKPGPCKYEYPFDTPENYLALQTLIEISSMVFITGLELQAHTNLSKGALVAIASTETRHNTWALMSNWHASPFGGPSDTYYPYANHLLQYTDEWVIKGSCPCENPEYPIPQQPLIHMSIDTNKTASIAPGSELSLVIDNTMDGGAFKEGQQYFAVFFHGLLNFTRPFHLANLSTEVPQELEPRGVYILVIATEAGATTAESVVAGPVPLLELPEKVGLTG